jgi:aminocarboxymuconate-semialdehyde decarboxylase
MEIKMIVDLHAHALSERFLAEMARKPISGFMAENLGHGEYTLSREGDVRKNTIDPHLFDIEKRLKSLRERKVAKQLVGPPPNLVSWPGGVPGVEHVRALHKMLKGVEDEGEGLVEAIGVVALGEPEKAADELQRAVDEYGFRQLILPTTAGGRPLDDPAFASFFALAERLGIVLFMHPVSPGPTDRYDHWGVGVLIGFPFETTLAITRMIFTGLLEPPGTWRWQLSLLARPAGLGLPCDWLGSRPILHQKHLAPAERIPQPPVLRHLRAQRKKQPLRH